MNTKKQGFVPKPISRACSFLNFPLGDKKASIQRIIGFLVVVLVVILLVFLIKNGWSMGAAAQDIMGMFSKK